MISEDYLITGPSVALDALRMIKLTRIGEFLRALDRHRDHNPRAPYLDPAPAIDARCFLADGHTGCAITPDGEITCLFSSVPGGGAAILAHAIAAGGTHLHCLGDGLRRYYERQGFRVTATYPWDPTQAPPDWTDEPCNYYRLDYHAQ